MQYASQNLIPVTLELGGKSPNIFFADVVDSDDDFFDKALEGFTMFALNQGEVCTCPSRALVQESIYERFIERAIERVKKVKQGNPLDDSTMIGAQASSEQLQKILSYVDIGKQEGAQVLTGGERATLEGDLAGGFYVKPTVFKGHNKMRIFQEEIFGPVLSVTTFKDEEEALAIANDTLYGLGAGVWTRSVHKALSHGSRDPGRPRVDQLLSPVSGARGVRRLQAVGHRPRESQDDARPLPADEEHARELRSEADGFLLNVYQRSSLHVTRPGRDARASSSEVRPDEHVTRVTATDAALQLIERLRQKHGPLLFHQSGGCCDGSSPMCYPRDEFLVGGGDVKLGEIGGVPFYMSASQFEYWQHTHLIIDVVPGRGGMFSLEGPEGLRFLTRSRLYSDDEWAVLKDIPVEKAG